MTDAIERALDGLHDQTPAERLVYLAVRDGDRPSARAISERTGFSVPTVNRSLTTLQDSGWVESQAGPQASNGKTITVYRACVECEDCGQRVTDKGYDTHRSRCADDRLHALDVQELDPEDVGLDSDVPEPAGGRR